MRGFAFDRREDRRLVLLLSATAFMLWVGASAILPLLPVFLRLHGSSPDLVGLTMAAYFAASLLTQYPVGHLADAIGEPPVIILGLVVFAIGSAGFALLAGPGAAIAFRALQGLGAGAVSVAAGAMIGRRVEPSVRGRAFSVFYGGQMLALAVGPLLGTIFGLEAMRVLFVVAAAVALGAIAPIVTIAGGGLLASVRPGGGASAAARTPLSELLANRTLVGVALQFGSSGVLVGVYESCWTLLLHVRHASSFDIGLSWTLFALPYVLLSLPAGRLAERGNRKVLATAALGSSAFFASLYPFLHLVALLVGLGALEAAGAVVGAPAALIILTSATTPESQGGAQGAIHTAQTAMTALGAAASGALFAAAVALPFELGAGLAGAMVLGALWCWRGMPLRAPAAAPAEVANPIA